MPSIRLKESAASSIDTPDTGRVSLFLDSSNGDVSVKDSSGTVFPLGGSGLTVGGDLVGTLPNPSLASTAVVAGAYGDASHIVTLTFDSKGRCTAATTVAVSIAESNLALTDITTNNASSSKHGFLPKLPNDATKVLLGDGTYAAPPAGAVSGIVTLAHGGTGADLSATGAAHSFVKQSSSGANLTVGTIAVADLPSMASSDFAGVCTDETGSGNLVFASGPTLSSPIVGTQSAHDASTKGASTAYVDTPEQWVALTDGSTITWDVGSRREAKGSVTLGGSRTLSITNAVNGSAGVIRVTQDGSGSRGLTLPSGSKIVGGGGTTAPLSTAASTVDLLAFEYDGTNYWWTIGKAAA